MGSRYERVLENLKATFSWFDWNGPVTPENKHGMRLVRYQVHSLARSIALREKCERCGGRAQQKHHPDYYDPRKLVHVCKACHRAIHAEMDVQRCGAGKTISHESGAPRLLSGTAHGGEG